MLNMNKILNRFLPKADNHTQRNDCWEWNAHRDRKEYGRFYLDGKVQSAHRVSWWLFNGEVSSDVCVCHSCDNPKCVNPEHLWLGTHQDNKDDAVSKDRHAKQKGYTKEDKQNVTYLYKQGQLTQRELADMYGCAVSLINKWIKEES